MLKTDTIQITPDLLALLTEIDEFKGAWRALGNLAPDRLRALRRVATIESIGSSTRIEGSKLTDREVEREKIVLADLPESAVKILGYARDQGRVTMRDMVRATGASGNTLKEHFRSLVAKSYWCVTVLDAQPGMGCLDDRLTLACTTVTDRRYL